MIAVLSRPGLRYPAATVAAAPTLVRELSTTGPQPASGGGLAASFSAVQLSSPPLTVAFTDTSTGSPTSWAWVFGDGATSVLQNPGHTYAAAGVYNVKLTVTNASGSTSITQPVTVTLASAPAPGGGFTAASGARSLWSDRSIKFKLRPTHIGPSPSQAHPPRTVVVPKEQRRRKWRRDTKT